MATDGTGKAPGRSTRFYAAVSITAALPTVGLKAAAYLITGSVGLLSDAAEPSANLVAAVGAFLALSAAARPPDEELAYGHTKAEFFFSCPKGLHCWEAPRDNHGRVPLVFRLVNTDAAPPTFGSRMDIVAG
jgi:Co/Zn/Cd efflux system component